MVNATGTFSSEVFLPQKCRTCGHYMHLGHWKSLHRNARKKGESGAHCLVPEELWREKSPLELASWGKTAATQRPKKTYPCLCDECPSLLEEWLKANKPVVEHEGVEEEKKEC